ncbi:MAG: hypothetical protein FWH35_09235 [Treponema sp.]|nr:hypothetical protein [Treponema sp.]
MNKFVLIFTLFLLTFMIFAKEVPATNQAIANALPGDHIIRVSGEKVVLRQADIDYAKRQIGLSSVPDTPNITQKPKANNSSFEYGGLIIFLLIVVVIIVIIGISVSNITTTVAKNSGMSEEDAKKVGTSAGLLAGAAATFAAAALLGKAGEFGKKKK